MASKYDMVDFKADVIDASEHTPVVIDFWAEWCGPCRVLGPTIDKLADQAEGKWNLVKIDTELHQDIAAQFQIRGIPAVKMVYQGKLIAEFSGALPEHEIKKWLDQHLPEIKIEGSQLELIHELIQSGEREQVVDLLKREYELDPSKEDVRLKLALHLLPDFDEDALQLIESLNTEGKYQFELDAAKLISSLKKGFNLPDSNPEKVKDLVEKGVTEMLAKNYAEAIELLIESLFYDKTFADEIARKTIVAIFKMLTESHPLVKKKQRAFSMALN